MAEQFETRRLHAGYDPAKHGHSPLVPIYQTAAFAMTDPNGANPEGFVYSRVGNPTVEAFENRICDLAGGVTATAVASGMAAITDTLLNVAEGGGRIIAPSNIYGAGLDEMNSLLPKFGIETDFVQDINDFAAVEALITPETKAIYTESVANPSTAIADIEGLAALAHKHHVPLIVDNTFPTPYLFRPLEHGADIDVYSSTKAINGHGNVVSGIVVDRGHFDWDQARFPQFHEKELILPDAEGEPQTFVEAFGNAAFGHRIRLKYVRLFGAVMSPFDAYLALLGIDTIAERLDKEVHNAVKVAQYLTTNPHVTAVHYAGLHPEDPLVKRYFPKGVGAIFSFELAATEAQVDKLLLSTKVFTYLPNVGDSRSLIVNPRRVTHREVPVRFRDEQGLTANLVRLSIGLEDADDLIADLDQAIAQAFE
ncbi:O-acetylhomoserine aminocarboxypropyltransferase/cysteine synthase family protein [Lacticaseibacillus sp. N501-2]|uniref:O-acetylhomoserine aminocarboxypropyltransferase/cysteine synthase family protein n=1 Tax=Lacticaseibacillus salsurae TaxID=3367729 RepID=UPI0038B2D466